MSQRCRVASCQRVVAFAGLLFFRVEHAAFAQDAIEPIALSYRAPEFCPSFEQFLAKVQHSTARVRLARSGEPARRFEVVVEPGGTDGHLELESGKGGERAVHGADCQAVADLLAFAVALAADPEAQPAEPATPVAAFPPVRSSPAPAPESAPVLAPVTAAPRPELRSPNAGTRWQWGVAGAGFATGASSPAVTWGGGIVAELGLNYLTTAPRFRLGANYASKTLEVTQPPGGVSLTNRFLSFEGCSGALRYRALTFLPCLRVHGGTRSAKGKDPLPGAREELRGFLDLGASGHLHWHFAGAGFVDLGTALMFATVRDHVKILPAATVYDVPALGVLGEIAIGVEFGDQNPG